MFPDFQAENVISCFLEIGLSLTHSGICTFPDSFSHLPPSTSLEAFRNLESGISSFSPPSLAAETAPESGIWNLTSPTQG